MKRWLAIGLRMLANRLDPPEREVAFIDAGGWPIIPMSERRMTELDLQLARFRGEDIP